MLHDLQPYLCTYDNCSSQDQLFATRRTWAEHESSAHRQSWRCFEHSLHYDTAYALRGHLIKDHAGYLAETQIDGLIDLSAVGLPDNRNLCPTCFRTPPFPKGLENHIANHLERFSIFALPMSCMDDQDAPHGSNATQKDGSCSNQSKSFTTLEFSDMGVSDDEESLDGVDPYSLASQPGPSSLEKYDSSSEESWGKRERDHELQELSEDGLHPSDDNMDIKQPQLTEPGHLPEQDLQSASQTLVEDEADNDDENIAAEKSNLKPKDKSNAGLDIAASFLSGCGREAERCDRVSVGLEGLRDATPESLHAHLNGLIAEIRNSARHLRDLADNSLVHISRLPVVIDYLNVILPCLCRSLMDIIEFYEDRSITRDSQWRKMYQVMGNELPGTTLPARFIIYNQFLRLIYFLLIKYDLIRKY